MGFFEYLDLEMTGLNPDIDKIITIQYQKIEIQNGIKLVGDLIILKEWESSEEEIVKKFYKIFMAEGDIWQFVPVMQNHTFDFCFLFTKFKKYCNYEPDFIDFIFKKPFIDIHYDLIMINNLTFKGSGLDKMTNKTMSGKQVPEWYANKEYSKIEDYIKMEKDAFMEFFSKLFTHLQALK